jgi:hypothetical protein
VKRTYIALALALSALSAVACGKKRDGQRPPPASKAISPAVVEPLPAPRGQPKLPPSSSTPTDTTTDDKDAGATENDEALTE